MPIPLVSLIVPVLNEERVIHSLLTHLCDAGEMYECLVVDGGSTDRTVEIIKAHGDPRIRLLHSEPGRGVQMNLGARHARGEVLVFHHADTVFSDGALQELVQVTQDPEVLWGGFQHQFSPANWKLDFISALHNFRFRSSGTVYGDQSMFARREFFEELGGFPEEPLEDMLFSDAACQHADSEKLEHHVLTESRKFTQMGEFRGLLYVLKIILRYRFNRAFTSEQFFEPYR